MILRGIKNDPKEKAKIARKPAPMLDFGQDKNALS